MGNCLNRFNSNHILDTSSKGIQSAKGCARPEREQTIRTNGYKHTAPLE